MDETVVCVLAGLGLLSTANALLRKGSADAISWSAAAAVCIAALLYSLGLPFLAATELILVVALLVLLRSQHRRSKTIEFKSDLRQRIVPVLVAGLLGLAAPVVFGGEVSNWAPHAPIEGTTAARGGAGMALEIFGRKLLTLVVLSLMVLASALALRGRAQGHNVTRDEQEGRSSEGVE